MTHFIKYKYLLVALLWLGAGIQNLVAQTGLRTLDDRTKNQQEILQNQAKAITDQQKMIYDLRDKLAKQETAIKVLESELKSKEESLRGQINWNISVMRIIAGFIIFGIAVVIWQRNFLGRNLLGVWIEENFKESIRYYLKDIIQRKVRDRDVREIVREKGKDAVEAAITKYVKEADLASTIAQNAGPEIEKVVTDLNQQVADSLKGKVPAWEQDFARYLTLSNKLQARTSILNENMSFPAEIKLELQEFKKVLFKLKNPPDFTPEDWYLKGVDEYEVDALKEAKESFTQVLYQNPEDLNAILFRGVIHRDNAEYRSALKVFNQVLNQNPDHKIAKVLRAYTHFKMKKYDKAVEDYTEILNEYQDYAYCYYGRGNAYKEKQDLRAAIENYGLAIDKNNNFALAYLSLIELLIISGSYEDAQSYLGQLKAIPELKIKDQILSQYFTLLLRNIQHMGTAEAEQNFEEIIEQDIEVVWDLTKIEKWVQAGEAGLDKDNVLFINKMTKILKGRITQGEQQVEA